MRTDACACTCTHSVSMASQIQLQSRPHLPWRIELSFGLIQGFTCSLQRAQQQLTILKLPFVHLQNLFFQLLTRSHRFIYNEPGSNISEVLHSSHPSKIRSCLLGKLALCNLKEQAGRQEYSIQIKNYECCAPSVKYSSRSAAYLWAGNRRPLARRANWA